MDIIKQQENCALCGLAVEIEEFSLTTADGLQKFCCAGCLSIYQLLNDEQGTLNDNTETPLTTQP
jgi:transposase-like protein